MLQDMGFWILNDIIWVKSNPMPNFRGCRFANAHETLIWCAPSEKAKPKFNYESMKIMNGDSQMRSDWHMPICSGKERWRDESGRKAHPTQKPEALLRRAILSCTDIGDVILDPFSGSGTTAATAKSLGRHYIGIERERSYAAAPRARLAMTDYPAGDIQALYQPVPSKRKAPRVPFSALLEAGDLETGDVLESKCRRFKAAICADASLKMKGKAKMRGSIHSLGAEALGSPSCNGWTFWTARKDGEAILLDDLRKSYLARADAISAAREDARAARAEEVAAKQSRHADMVSWAAE